jgi:hypothetical protein
MKLKKKQWMVVGGIALVLLVGGGAFGYTKMKSKPAGEEQGQSKKKRLNEQVNVIPVEERPYLQIIPQADGHNLVISLNEVKKAAESGEYELEYQAGSLLQGAFGQLEVGTLPSTTKVLLGSCSAGGACTFHEDVQGGTLLTRYDGAESYALKSRWKYIDNKAGETSHSSSDAMFQIESKGLEDERYIVIFNTAGYPKGLKSVPVSEIYSLTSSGSLKGKASLTIRSQQEGNLQIMGYDGKTWHEFDTTAEGKMAKAEVDLMELYTVVSK